jgi:hypothetical protein
LYRSSFPNKPQLEATAQQVPHGQRPARIENMMEGKSSRMQEILLAQTKRNY